jgi:hypothetical protein
MKDLARLQQQVKAAWDRLPLDVKAKLGLKITAAHACALAPQVPQAVTQLPAAANKNVLWYFVRRRRDACGGSCGDDVTLPVTAADCKTGSAAAGGGSCGDDVTLPVTAVDRGSPVQRFWLDRRIGLLVGDSAPLSSVVVPSLGPQQITAIKVAPDQAF